VESPDALAALIRTAPGLRAKRELAVITRLGPTDGDDAAVVPHADGFLLLCGEAIDPAFVGADPFGAGAAAVATNVSDIRAMGGRPLGLVDMLVSPDRAHAERVMDGLAWASRLLGVPVVGGHLTIGGPPALSASITGTAARPLRSGAARPGDVLLAAFCLEGGYRSTLPYFSSLRTRPPDALRDDGEALVEVAGSGAVHAARDISMPGVAGSLLQMLEAAGAGAVLDLAALPRPDGVGLRRWLLTFPSFGFVLCAPPGRVDDAVRPFARRGLACAPCGRVDDTRRLRVRAAGREALVWDLNLESLTR
jgi:hypothetical protein